MKTFILSFRFQGDSMMGTKILLFGVSNVRELGVTPSTIISSDYRRDFFISYMKGLVGENNFKEDPCTSLVLVRSSLLELDSLIDRIQKRCFIDPKDHIVIFESGELGGRRILNKEIKGTEDVSRWISGDY